MNASSRVDSYQSSAGPYGGANIRSNAIVRAGSSIIVNGGVIGGATIPNSPAQLDAIAVPTGATNLPAGSASPGNLNINIAADSITLSPGTYVVANLNVNFPGAINISPAGQVDIFVTGTLNLGGNENAGGAPRNLQFLVASSGTVNVNSRGTLVGLIYAPTSTVNLNSTVFGAVVGSSVTLNSGAAVHFDESSVCTSVAAQPPTPLPRLPPGPRGCYVRTADGWRPDTCATAEFIDAHFGRPAVPVNLSSDSFVDAGMTQRLPYVYGQFQAFLPAVGSEVDAFVNRMNKVCPATRDSLNVPSCKGKVDTDAPRWSFQSNTNGFAIPGGDTAAVQFVLQSNGVDNAICVWNIDVTAQDYSHKQCYTPRPKQRAGGFQPFDWGNVAGYIEDGTGDLVLIAAMSWADADGEYQFAVRTADFYGLKGKWFAFDGDLLGIGCCTDARFTDTSMVARMAVSSCSGDTTALSDISACPPPNLQPHVSIRNGTGTQETNNLIQLAPPRVSYPNAQLAVTSWTSTTSGACVDPKHVFVRDYEDDTGGVPSNLNKQAFWESPDIFLVPQGTPVDVNASVRQSLVTPGASFDVYVRVHNDLGCADVTGAKALVYLADPSALSTQWTPLTGGNYLGDNAAPDGDTVAAGGQALIGPFTFTAPSTGLGDGHKCLIAAILAKDEPKVTDNFDAPKSNQVAQRNVEFSSTCTYPLTNGTSADGNVEITLTAVPPERPPSLTGSTHIEVSFDDPDGRWFGVWNAQAGQGTDFTVTSAGGKTTVRLGKPRVSLDAVVLHAGETRVSVGTLDLPANAEQSTLNIQATLTGSAGTGVVKNGGSCKAGGPPVN